MKKLSIRMRVTVLTALCLTAASVAMSIFMLIIVDSQIVNPIEFGVASDTVKESFGSTNEEQISQGDDIFIDNAGLIIESGVKKLKIYSILVLIAIIIFGTFIAWIIAGIAIKPLKDLNDNIRNITENNLSTEICGSFTNDEIGEIAVSFNKMLKRLNKAFQREKRFSAAAAHELKTPLTVMKSGIEVLELSESPDIDEYKETVAYLKKQVYRMTDLIKQLLDFASYSNSNDGTKETVDLKQMLSEIIDCEKKKCPKSIEIRTDLQECVCHANSVLIKQAITNLIDNAIKYSDEKGVVYISLKKDNKHIRIQIKDNGIGISKEAAEYIFEPFYREDKSRSRKTAGSGLGLSLVKEICEQCNYNIEYFENDPKGSIFVLTL